MPYHDRDSSPDYASRPSEDIPIEKERVRGGARKVVGSAGQDRPQDVDNLTIDFGQTLRLTPESGSQSSISRPGTAGGRRSPFDALARPASAGGRRSPFDSLGDPTGRKSPLNPFEDPSPARTPEKQSPREHLSHSRSQSYAWQPGSRGNEGRDGLSAAEFVAQRYAQATKPQGYIPHRTQSSGRIEQIKSEQQARPSSPTSPKKLRKRMPSSRDSSGTSLDFSAHLSAREQEHVAKMTGGPLLSNVNQQSRSPDPQIGLIGAIGAREQERRDIKEGLQGRMVQAAIDQRQRESRMLAHQRSQSQYMAQQHAMQQQMMPQQMQSPQYPMASSYNAQQYLPNNQAYQYPQQVQPQQQSVQNYQQSMYGMQSAQSQQMNIPMQPSAQQDYRPQPPPPHQRSQSSYSNYGGFYTPQSR